MPDLPATAELVASVPGDQLQWIIPAEEMVAGNCFYVTAVNGAGLESEASEKWCIKSIPKSPDGLIVVRVTDDSEATPQGLEKD